MNKTYQNSIQKIINFLIIFACFSIAMPTAWISVSSGLILIVWIISGNYFVKFKRIFYNPAAISALILFVLYIIGTIYSSASSDQSEKFLLKYLKLLLIPIVISIVDSNKIRNYAINAFLIGAFMLLIISYLKWLGILPMNLGLHDLPDNSQGFLAFKNRIAHNILMSFLMFISFSKSYYEKSRFRWFWFILGILILLNIMYLVGGRSGQVIAVTFLVFLPFYFYGVKTLKYFLILLIIIFAFKSHVSLLIPARLLNVTQEVSDYKSSENLTSAGIRMEMFRNTMALIKKSPLIGYGTGALKSEYNRLANTQETLLKDVPNPHNQYLLTFFEIGIVGLIAFLYMFYKQWNFSNNSKLIDIQIGLYMKGLILTIAIGSLFNSLLLDATEGKFYCILTGVFLSCNKEK